LNFDQLYDRVTAIN